MMTRVVFFMLASLSILLPQQHVSVKAFGSHAFRRSKLILSNSIGNTCFYSGFSTHLSSSTTDSNTDADTNTNTNTNVEKDMNMTTATVTATANADKSTQNDAEPDGSMYLSEGLFAVYKPLEWTSQDVVAYLRGMLQRDARDRGFKVERTRKRGNKKRMIKIGHGGTLDPLATGVLVIGVGLGTKQLQSYLDGAKSYRASVKLGFETDTLDMEGKIVKNAAFDAVTNESIEAVIPSFTGKIMQIPPIYSALKKNGRKMYEEAREGKTEEELEIEAREVEIHSLEFLPTDHKGEGLPSFGLDIACGGGTYIRSLVRDIGRSVDSAATMTWLERTQQGPFELKHALLREDWSPENIYAAIERSNEHILK